MNNFTFSSATKIIFGKGSESQVGELSSQYGKRILLHYGGGSIKKIGLYDKVLASLKAVGLEVVELGGVQPNPRVELVREGVKIAKANKIDLILAVGGGSVIDSAKAIGMGAFYDGDVWDFYSGKATATKTIPVATVLTIPAAGSESSNSTVISNEQTNQKKGCTNDITFPVFSILNPEFTYTLPPYQIACGASDMLAHMLERYFVNTNSVALTDRLIEGSIKTVLEYAPLAIKNQNDYDIRAELMLTGTIAHNGFLDIGRGGDWASHGIEHEISAVYDIAHGAGLAIVFPAWMKYVSKTNPFKLVQLGKRVFHITKGTDNEVISETIKHFEEFFKSIGMPIRLSDIDIDDKNIEHMAKKASEGWGSDKIGSYVSLGFEDILEILRLAL